MAPRRVVLIALGGTIAMAQDTGAGVTPSLGAQDLVGAVTGLSAMAPLETETLFNKPGSHLTFDDIAKLATRLNSLLEDGRVAAVITQGTDTLEETAFALDLLTAVPAPIVMTGAMRPPRAAGADGPANVLAAVRVALEPHAGQFGVLVVMGDDIHLARFVSKTHTQSPAAFQSSPGPVGCVADDTVVLNGPAPNRTILRPPSQSGPDVALIKVGLDDSGLLVRAAAADPSIGGIVLEAMGGGHVPPGVRTAAVAAAAQIPVVLASRTGAGRVLTNTYGFEGAETDLLGNGLISARTLPGLKARVLLTLLLRAEYPVADMPALFATIAERGPESVSTPHTSSSHPGGSK